LLAGLSLKYHTPVIEIINNQGEFINLPTNFFNGKLLDGHFDIKIGGKTQLIAKGSGKQNSHEELGKAVEKESNSRLRLVPFFLIQNIKT
jgi:hypothetical protein